MRVARLLLLPLLLGAGWPDLLEPVRSGAQAPTDAALLVGAELFGSLPSAKGAGRDLMAAWTWATWTRGVPLAQVIRLPNPSARDVQTGLERAASGVGPGGVLWVFWSGHGARDASGRPILLTADARSNDLEVGAVPLDALLQRLTASEAQAIVVVLDLTFRGLDREGAPLVDEPAWGPPLPPPVDPRVVLWTAGDDVAAAHRPAQMGLLTWHTLGALRGWADGVSGAPDGQITLAEVAAWVDRAAARAERSPPHLPVPEALGGLVVATGRLQAAPELPDAATLGEAPTAEAEAEVPEDSAARLTEQAEAVRKEVQAEADRAWSRVLGAGPAGSPELAQALGDFLNRFGQITFLLPEGEVVISAEQAPRARSMLAHGGVLTPSLVPSAVLRAPGQPPLRVALRELTWQQRAMATGEALPEDLRGDMPLTGISWYEAISLCNLLSMRDGLTPVYSTSGRTVTMSPTADGWRLPTEAEWERAAGALRWPGFDDPALSCEHANLADDPARCDDHATALRRPGQGRPNEHGLHDMAGNVAEWTWDAWTPHPDPRAPAPHWDGAQRVVKGGSWKTPVEEAQRASRAPESPGARRDDLGLRLVRWEDLPLRMGDTVYPDEEEGPEAPELPGE